MTKAKHDTAQKQSKKLGYRKNMNPEGYAKTIENKRKHLVSDALFQLRKAVTYLSKHSPWNIGRKQEWDRQWRNWRVARAELGAYGVVLENEGVGV